AIPSPAAAAAALPGASEPPLAANRRPAARPRGRPWRSRRSAAGAASAATACRGSAATASAGATGGEGQCCYGSCDGHCITDGSCNSQDQCTTPAGDLGCNPGEGSGLGATMWCPYSGWAPGAR
ncbi:unnamed protein product, partial [Prorocentrum cordatum]